MEGSTVIIYIALFSVVGLFCFYIYKVGRVQNHPSTFMRDILQRLALLERFNYVADEQRAPTDLSRDHATSEAGLLEYTSAGESIYGTFVQDDAERTVDFVVSGVPLPSKESFVAVRGARPLETESAEAEQLEEIVIAQRAGRPVKVKTNDPESAQQFFSADQERELETFEARFSRTVTVEVVHDRLLLRVPVELNEEAIENICTDAMELGLSLHKKVRAAVYGAQTELVAASNT